MAQIDWPFVWEKVGEQNGPHQGDFFYASSSRPTARPLETGQDVIYYRRPGCWIEFTTNPVVIRPFIIRAFLPALGQDRYRYVYRM